MSFGAHFDLFYFSLMETLHHGIFVTLNGCIFCCILLMFTFCTRIFFFWFIAANCFRFRMGSFMIVFVPHGTLFFLHAWSCWMIICAARRACTLSVFGCRFFTYVKSWKWQFFGFRLCVMFFILSGNNNWISVAAHSTKTRGSARVSSLNIVAIRDRNTPGQQTGLCEWLNL